MGSVSECEQLVKIGVDRAHEREELSAVRAAKWKAHFDAIDYEYARLTEESAALEKEYAEFRKQL